MNKRKNFVKTSSESTAADLRRAGLVELAKEGKYFVFLNSTTRDFENDSIDESKVLYTNIMSV